MSISMTSAVSGVLAGVFFWPGSEAEIRGHRPTLYMKYNESIPFEQRINTALGWFTEQNMSFVAMYFNEPDTTSHKYGPDSQQVADKVNINIYLFSDQFALLLQLYLLYL